MDNVVFNEFYDACVVRVEMCPFFLVEFGVSKVVGFPTESRHQRHQRVLTLLSLTEEMTDEFGFCDARPYMRRNMETGCPQKLPEESRETGMM